MADSVYAASSVDTVGTKDANATAIAQQARASDGEEVKGPEVVEATEDAQTEEEAVAAAEEGEANGKDGD